MTGLRRAELLALRWFDVDLAAGRLTIRRNYLRRNRQSIEKDTKTHQMRRISLELGHGPSPRRASSALLEDVRRRRPRQPPARYATTPLRSCSPQASTSAQSPAASATAAEAPPPPRLRRLGRRVRLPGC